MSYNNARVTLPLLLKGYCFLRVSYLYDQMRVKIELSFEVADKRKMLSLDIYLKENLVALSNLFYFLFF